MFSQRARSASDAAVLRRKGHLKEQVGYGRGKSRVACVCWGGCVDQRATLYLGSTLERKECCSASAQGAPQGAGGVGAG